MGDLVAAVRAQLDEWRLAESAEGVAALDIARRLDDPDLAPSGAALLHQQLGSRLTELRKLAPEPETSDEIDEVQGQRDKRRREAGLA